MGEAIRRFLPRSAKGRAMSAHKRPSLEELEARTLPSSVPWLPALVRESIPTPSTDAVFATHTGEWQVYLQPDGNAELLSAKRTLRLEFVGANDEVQAIGIDRDGNAGAFTALRNPDGESSGFDAVRFRNVYDGIDVVYRQTRPNHLEFMFVVRPGADPRQIKVAYHGAKRLMVDAQHDLQIHFAGQRFTQRAPVAFQKAEAGRQEVAIRPWLDNRDQLRFRIANYDRAHTLVIDPEFNYPPSVTDDTYGVIHDRTLVTPASQGVLANDYDPEHDPLTAHLVSGPSHGALTLNSDGSFTYIPEAGFVGTDEFSYRAFDGVDYSSMTATAYIGVTNYHAPVSDDDYYTVLHDAPLAGNVLDNDYDGDLDELTVILLSGPSHAASFTFNADGSFNYTGALHWTGLDQFSYQTSDGVAEASGTAFITVTNQGPSIILEEPEPVCVCDPVTLSGSFTDPDDPTYDGPYTLTVNWGDGTTTQDSFASPDAFEYQHIYDEPGVYNVTVQVQDSAGANAGAAVQARVARVQAVDWVALDSPLDNNPGNGTPNTAVGLRIYPDKTTPEDALNRRRVRIRATVNPAVAGIKVYFNTVDVDDPSANTAPIDQETQGGNEIPDNSDAGSLTSWFAFTDANGVATVDFDVSLQPGDNWRAAATCDPGKIDGLRGKQNDAPQVRVIDAQGNFLPSADVKVSGVLTVWRRLHVEVDSMGAPPPGQQFDADDLLAADVPDPDIGAFAEAFRTAYITSQRDTGHDNASTPWVYRFQNATGGYDLAALNNYFVNGGAAQRGTREHEAIDYWVVYVAGVYEIVDSEDNDPNDNKGNPGTNVGPEPEYALIAQEVLRDMGAEWGWNAAQITHARRAVTLHEVGHQFGLQHNPPGPDGNPMDVMWVPADNAQESRIQLMPLVFAAADIAFLRDNPTSP